MVFAKLLTNLLRSLLALRVPYYESDLLVLGQLIGVKAPFDRKFFVRCFANARPDKGLMSLFDK